MCPLGRINTSRVRPGPNPKDHGLALAQSAKVGLCLGTAEMRCPFRPNALRTLRTFNVNARPSWMLGATDRPTACFITFLLSISARVWENQGPLEAPVRKEANHGAGTISVMGEIPMGSRHASYTL
jgi:hypothetical protein